VRRLEADTPEPRNGTDEEVRLGEIGLLLAATSEGSSRTPRDAGYRLGPAISAKRTN
jgi:hypothetical protein